MPSTQDIPPLVPLHTAYPPDAIIILAHKSHRVTLNIRPDHWPLPIKNAYHADPQWKARVERHHGRLMYPLFTEFLKHRNPGMKAVISCQDAQGGIYTLVDAITDIHWIGGPNDHGEKGAHACIWLEGKRIFGAPHGSLWGNYVLAAGDIHPSAMPMSIRDPHGTHFVETFMQNVVR